MCACRLEKLKPRKMLLEPGKWSSGGNESSESDLCYLFERDWIIPPPTIFGYINLANQLTVRTLCVKMQELCKIPTKLPINPSRNSIKYNGDSYLAWVWLSVELRWYVRNKNISIPKWTCTRSFDSWLKTIPLSVWLRGLIAPVWVK